LAVGQARLTLLEGLVVEIHFAEGDAFIETRGARVRLLSSNLQRGWLVNGIEENPATLIAAAIAQIRELPATAWSSVTRVIVALTLLHSLPVWQQNTQAALRIVAAPGYFCKVSCAAVAGIVVSVAVAACGAALAACAAGTVPSMGGIAIPCALVAKLCSAAVLAGGLTAISIAIYEGWLEFVWGA
jgi:hypothetical protein